jgi:predicted glycogen debranching enzyme
MACEQERRRALLTQAGEAAGDEFGAQLVLAADQFLIRPVGRAEHRAGRSTEEISARTVIAGYHWFTDWGRDTMISFEGLTLTTRRFAEARQILFTVRQLCARRVDPEPVPLTATPTASTTPPMRRCGSSTRSRGMSAGRVTPQRSASCCRR